MPTLAGFPQCEIQFDQTAALLNAAEVQSFFAGFQPAGITDLLVFSHGWNNDMADARQLNEALFERIREIKATPNLPSLAPLAGRSFAVLTVLWPSKRFTDAELIPGGAAAFGSAPEQTRLLRQLDDMKRVFPGADAAKKLDEAKTLVPRLPNEPKARDAFADLVRGLLTKTSKDPEDAADLFLSLSGDELLNRLQGPSTALPTGPATGLGGASAVGGAMGPSGGAAGLTSFFGGIVTGAQNLLNLSTYYEMKERAGLVGVALGATLAPLGTTGPRLHLIGHSFGGRVVTAAANALAGSGTPVQTLTLLQAAFSHYGLAEKYDDKHDGAFRAVLTQQVVIGSILITCTANDNAVGLAYPLASRLARQVGAKFGDANDRFGGLGRNGAQKTPETEAGIALQPVGGAYAFLPGRVFNLRADAFISEHSDITGPQVAYALLTSIAGT
jgi:hypothetical protein